MNTIEAHTYFLKNLLGDCCKQLVELVLQQHQYTILELNPPKITVFKEQFNEEEFEQLLLKYGLSVIREKELLLVEKIKQAVVELVHYSNNVNSIVRKSEYIVEKIGMQYQQISRIFSKHQGITLEKYILLHKIERVKELVLQGEYTVSEIAYIMDFSSVHHLSNTFKKYTGITISDFKQNPHKARKLFENM